MLSVTSGIHNHQLSETLVGHAYAGWLTSVEKNVVEEMSSSGVQSVAILATIKSRNINHVSTMKIIYNAKGKLRISKWESITVMQQLMKLLGDKHYVYWYRTNESTIEVEDIFWAHPNSIQPAKYFSSIFIIDCIYKTNRYKMPLFEMVGITSCGRTFNGEI